jgi:hypothetical protein
MRRGSRLPAPSTLPLILRSPRSGRLEGGLQRARTRDHRRIHPPPSWLWVPDSRCARSGMTEGGDPAGQGARFGRTGACCASTGRRIASTHSLLAGAGGGGPGRRVLWGALRRRNASREGGAGLQPQPEGWPPAVSRGSGRRGGRRSARRGWAGRGSPAPRHPHGSVHGDTTPHSGPAPASTSGDRKPPSLLPLSARLVVAEGRARRWFRPGQGCTITPAAGPSRLPRRPGDPALP